MHYSWGKIRMSSCIGGPKLPSALIIIPVRPNFWQPKENKIKPHLRQNNNRWKLLCYHLKLTFLVRGKSLCLIIEPYLSLHGRVGWNGEWGGHCSLDSGDDGIKRPKYFYCRRRRRGRRPPHNIIQPTPPFYRVSIQPSFVLECDSQTMFNSRPIEG